MTMVAWSNRRLDVPTKQTSDATSLRALLADRWAILFSHPEDFAQEDLEMDRWVSVLCRSFSARGVVPVALARAGSDPEQGWLGRLKALDPGAATILPLDALRAPLTDLSAWALRTQIARSGPRFAMIIDANLRHRRTLSYRSRFELPSPLDLIGWAVALRKRDSFRQSSGEMPEPSLPPRPVWGANERYAMAFPAQG